MQQMIIPYILALIYNSDNELLLLHRKQVTWFPDHYSLPGGKIESDESAKQALARELFEELNITIDRDTLQFAHAMHFMGETEPCVALFFNVQTWQGKLINKEPDKHDRICWFSADKLPEKLIPRHRKAIELVEKNILYSEDNWPNS